MPKTKFKSDDTSKLLLTKLRHGVDINSHQITYCVPFESTLPLSATFSKLSFELYVKKVSQKYNFD